MAVCSDFFRNIRVVRVDISTSISRAYDQLIWHAGKLWGVDSLTTDKVGTSDVITL